MTDPLRNSNPASRHADDWLSALADGELDARDCAQITLRWREEEEVRVTWQAYQTIGDVLRSDDLAGPPRRQQDFLQRLRVQLDAEPTVIAPAAVVEQRPASAWRRSRWQRPVAVAAGFAAVAGVTFVLRTSEPGASSPMVAVAPAAGPVTQVSNLAPAPRAAAVTTDMRVIRDARLDRYLAAHRPFSLGGPLGVPVGAVRHAELTASDR